MSVTWPREWDIGEPPHLLPRPPEIYRAPGASASDNMYWQIGSSRPPPFSSCYKRLTLSVNTQINVAETQSRPHQYLTLHYWDLFISRNTRLINKLAGTSLQCYQDVYTPVEIILLFDNSWLSRLSCAASRSSTRIESYAF